MKTTAIFVTVLAAVAIAAPAPEAEHKHKHHHKHHHKVCGKDAVPYCCEVDILPGLSALCAPVTHEPKSKKSFKKNCKNQKDVLGHSLSASCCSKTVTPVGSLIDTVLCFDLKDLKNGGVPSFPGVPTIPGAGGLPIPTLPLTSILPIPTCIGPICI